MAKIYTILLGVVHFLLLSFLSKTGAARKSGACFEFNQNGPCSYRDFKCIDSDRCIKSEKYCNGYSDCLDGSDEKYCKGLTWERVPSSFLQCRDSRKYVPITWICNGIRDCPLGEDEKGCKDKYNPRTSILIAKQKAIDWLKDQTQSSSLTEKWGKLVHKSAVALYLADPDFTTEINATSKEIVYELSIQLLSRLARNKLEISSSDLASFINAFLVTCLDPRNFHGINLIAELRKRVDSENGTNPYLILTLCNAGESITDSDKNKLIYAFWNSPREFWTETQAVVIMALSCARGQSENIADSELLSELAMELKQHQYRNGTVQNLQTTALVLQALYSAEPDEDPESFNDVKALETILSYQQEGGSFGNFMKTYYVLPVLNCKSLVNISSSHCNITHKSENSAMQDLVNQIGPKVKVQYSLWTGEQRYIEKMLTLRVPAKISAYGVMETAADIDSTYKFEYVVKNGKPYITAISGILDDSENGKFWFPYVIEDGRPVPIETSPADVIPKDNEHFVMWYRNVSWTK